MNCTPPIQLIKTLDVGPKVQMVTFKGIFEKRPTHTQCPDINPT